MDTSRIAALSVQVRCTLVDLRRAESTAEEKPVLGAFLGEAVDASAEGREARLVVGFGPLQPSLVVSPEQVSAVPSRWNDEPPEKLLLAYYLSHLQQLLRSGVLDRTTRVIVVGIGLLGTLAMHLLRAHGVHDVWGADQEPARRWWTALDTKQLMVLPRDGGRNGRRRMPPQADVLLDTTSDASVWQEALRFVRPHGDVHLLVLPGTPPSEVNFYPYIHRNSLTVRAYPLGQGAEVSTDDTTALTQLLSRVDVPDGSCGPLAMPIDRPGVVVSWLRSRARGC